MAERNSMVKSSFVLLLILLATASAGTEFLGGPSIVINETEGSVVITLQRDSSSGAEPVSVEFLTLQEFADEGSSICQLDMSIDLSTFDAAEASDIPASPINDMFEDGESTKSLIITITNDDIAEPLEAFVAVITGSTGNCALPVIISDDDVVRLSFNMMEATLTVSENITYTELSLLKMGTHEQDVPVTIGIRSASATEGLDFVLPRTDFVFNSSTDSLTVPIDFFHQNRAENDENLNICLSASSDDHSTRVEAVDPSCFTMTLFDDDVALVGFANMEGNAIDTARPISMTEGDPEVQVCIGFIGGNLDTGVFIEVTVNFASRIEDSYDRVMTSNFERSFGSLGPTPAILQLASQFQVLSVSCSTVRAVQNGIVDGHEEFTIRALLIGPSSLLPVEIRAGNLTLQVLDDDINSIALTVTSSGGPVITREGPGKVTIPEISLSRMGPNTSLTYEVTLRTEPPHIADFVLDRIIIEPSMDSVPLTLTFVDDAIPESVEEFDIFIESISLGNGRSGNVPPIEGGRVTLQVQDNDIAVGFTETRLRIEEGSRETLSLEIFQPSLEEVDPQATFPVTLELRVDPGNPQGDVSVTVEPEVGVVLRASKPSTSLMLTAIDDDQCTGEKLYTLSYTYDGPNTYTVVQRGRGTVELTVTDNDCVTSDPVTSDPVTSDPATSDPATSYPVVGFSSDPVAGITSDPVVGFSSDPVVGLTTAATSEPKKSVCVICIVVPIILLLILLCLCCILLILLWFFCCKKRCWHTYDPRQREKKFGMNPLPLDLDDEIMKYGKLEDHHSPTYV